LEDVEVRTKRSDNHQGEASTSIPESLPANEIRETKETDENGSMKTSNEMVDRNLEIQQTGANLERTAVKNERRRGEREAPKEQITNEKMAEGTNSKPRKRRKKSLAAAGACKKKNWKC
jgi:hypothetical protein